MDGMDLQDVPLHRRAAVAEDAITNGHRQHDREHRRPRALTARDALAALHFECLVLWTAWANLLHGVELTEADHERIRVAMSRIEHITDEALR